jgi:hypothetical protein
VVQIAEPFSPKTYRQHPVGRVAGDQMDEMRFATIRRFGAQRWRAMARAARPLPFHDRFYVAALCRHRPRMTIRLPVDAVANINDFIAGGVSA